LLRTFSNSHGGFHSIIPNSKNWHWVDYAAIARYLKLKDSGSTASGFSFQIYDLAKLEITHKKI